MLAQELRRIVIEQSRRANVGHIGSSLSIIEIIVAIYKNIINIADPDDADRDRFILSKGHAALALYAMLYSRGWISEEELNSYCTNGTQLGVHPEHFLKGVDFSTGSLGQGLSFAVGAALAASLQNSKRNVYVVMSDAECNEGSVWEAIMFAAHHKLSNLIVVVDDNKQQALGYTKDVISLQPLADRWKAFGWEAVEVDGHDIEELTSTITQFDKENGKPHVVIAQTTFGKGVSYMESEIAWHYLPLSQEKYLQALAEINEEQ